MRPARRIEGIQGSASAAEEPGASQVLEGEPRVRFVVLVHHWRGGLCSRSGPPEWSVGPRLASFSQWRREGSASTTEEPGTSQVHEGELRVSKFVVLVHLWRGSLCSRSQPPEWFGVPRLASLSQRRRAGCWRVKEARVRHTGVESASGRRVGTRGARSMETTPLAIGCPC